MSLLRDHGTAALTLRGTARAAGVSQTAPYKHFSDKAALLAALAEKGFRQLSGRLDAAGQSVKGSRNKLQRVGQAYVEFAIDEPFLYQLMFSSELNDVRKGQTNLTETARRTYRILEEALSAVVDEPDEARVACVAAWSLVHGLSLLLMHGGIEVEQTSHAVLVERVTALFAATVGTFDH
jgi:AcrR family transcriptional regulator